MEKAANWSEEDYEKKKLDQNGVAKRKTRWGGEAKEKPTTTSERGSHREGKGKLKKKNERRKENHTLILGLES